MQLTVILRKEVTDAAQAQQLFDIVKDKLADYPDIKISGKTNEDLVVNP